jgi:hypothetical protein
VSIPGTAKWVLLALVGLAIAIGVAIAAADLTSQQIGIASESVSAGDTLAPSLHVPAEKQNGEGSGHHPEPPGETTTTVPSESPTTPFEEASPPEETVETPGKSEGDDSGGHGSDGDD